jgi:hypothetical protein
MTGRARRKEMQRRVRAQRGPTGKPFDSMGIRPGGGFMSMFRRMMGGGGRQAPQSFGRFGQPQAQSQYPNMETTPEQQAAVQQGYGQQGQIGDAAYQAQPGGGVQLPDVPGTMGNPTQGAPPDGAAGGAAGGPPLPGSMHRASYRNRGFSQLGL